MYPYFFLQGGSDVFSLPPTSYIKVYFLKKDYINENYSVTFICKFNILCILHIIHITFKNIILNLTLSWRVTYQYHCPCSTEDKFLPDLLLENIEDLFPLYLQLVSGSWTNGYRIIMLLKPLISKGLIKGIYLYYILELPQLLSYYPPLTKSCVRPSCEWTWLQWTKKKDSSEFFENLEGVFTCCCK